MNRIILIIPYYGKWPIYFPFYLQSLSDRNFDLLLITDLSLDGYVVPTNVKVLNRTFAQLQDMFAQKLGNPVDLQSPMRLCDFKPMYGRIFEDYIRSYEYWAFGDCDLVYGRAFDAYLNSKCASGFDALSLCTKWPTGSFFTIRNCEKMNRYYERVSNWRDVCTLRDKMYVNFDEIGGNFYEAVRAGKMTLQDCRKIRDSFGASLFCSDDVDLVREDVHSETWLKGECLEVDGDRLLLNGREIPIFHFVLAKGRRYFKFLPMPTGGGSHYFVNDTGFHFGSWRWHWVEDGLRKSTAIFQSLCVNGVQRLTK